MLHSSVARESRQRHLSALLGSYAAMAVTDPRRAELRAQLVVAYLPLAQHIARRYVHRGEPLPDLEQAASIGLIAAIDRFDPDKGHSFTGYAIPTITGEVRRHFRDTSWSIRVPRRLTDLNVSINAVVIELSQSLGRAPRPSEIATRLDVSVEKVLEAVQAGQAHTSRSLDELLAAETYGPAVSDSFGGLDAGYERFLDSHALAPYLRVLLPREKRILMLRFHDELTQSQIGALLGISQMQVSRLLASILARLRDAINHDQPPARGTSDAGDTPHLDGDPAR
jgi:RNA polymerase sigma-B factor